MKLTTIVKLIVAVGASALAGAVGALFTTPAISSGWYALLQKPSWNPPSWVFGPAWTTLYLLMGISAFLIWQKGLQRRDVRGALTVFGLQLVFNAAWSVIFFGARNLGGAFVEIIFLWISIVVTMVLFAKISKVAVWLLVPYILWVSFASYLNYTIWTLNENLKIDEGRQVACTMEARLCPDGSAVGRSGPNCEFAQCPAVVSTTSPSLIIDTPAGGDLPTEVTYCTMEVKLCPDGSAVGRSGPNCAFAACPK